MSDRAVKGPATRRRRTTISGGGNGGVSIKQANGSKWHDAGEKPPRHPAKAKTDEVLRHASNHGEADTQIANTPRKPESVAEDGNDRLR